jgi:hypothetical protein
MSLAVSFKARNRVEPNNLVASATTESGCYFSIVADAMRKLDAHLFPALMFIEKLMRKPKSCAPRGAKWLELAISSRVTAG